ncbi:hypothetical protein GEMRC1_005371 [Eukaryota sp. GEM-RC1]
MLWYCGQKLIQDPLRIIHITPDSNLGSPFNASLKALASSSPIEFPSRSTVVTEVLVFNASINNIEIEPDEALIISTDSSEYAVSGVIWGQLIPSNLLPAPNFQDLKLAPVSFIPRPLRVAKKMADKSKRIVHQTIVATLTQPNISYLLLNRTLKLYCDHKNIAYLLAAPEKSRIVKRWLPTLCALDFEVYHVDGESNLFADLLSRLNLKKQPEAVVAKSTKNESQSWPNAGFMSDLVLGPSQVPYLAISPARRVKLCTAELVVKSCQPMADTEGDRDTVRISKLTPAIIEEDKFLPRLMRGWDGVVIDHWLASDLYLLCCEQ